MLPQNPQNGQQYPWVSQQQSFVPSSPHNMNLDSPSYMGMDPSVAAKQMASLTAVGVARVAKVAPERIPAYPQAPHSGGAPLYLPPTNDHMGHDNPGANPFGALSAYPTFQAPNSISISQQQQQQQQLSNPGNSFMGDSNMAGPNPPPASTLKQRQRAFLTGLSGVMNAKGTPLPPALTGVPDSRYDPLTSPWKALELSTELGAFRVAGKDVDLFKLWGTVFQAGGHAKVTQQTAWGQLCAHFDLPERTIVLQSNGQQISQPVAHILRHYYESILGGFEAVYKNNISQQHRRALSGQMRPGDPQASPARMVAGSQQAGPSSQPSQQGAGGGAGNVMGMVGQPISNAQSSGASVNSAAPFPLQPTSQNPHLHQPPSTPSMQSTAPNISGIDGNLPQPSITEIPTQTAPKIMVDHEQDGLSHKRKLESEDDDAKRARQKTESEPSENSNSTMTDRSSLPPNGSSSVAGPSTVQIPPLPIPAPQPKRQRSRRKIEYNPLERDLETHGGRDLRILEDDWSQRKPLRDINEWGRVDIEAVTMSLRSRISTEVSYALTTLTLISTMKGQAPGTGFPISQCEDLMEELLDLLEDEAFNGVPDPFETQLAPDACITTHREIINAIQDEGLRPFASLEHRQGAKDRNIGPKPRPGHTVLVIMNVLRNLTVFTDNYAFMASHERFLDLFLRVSSVVRTGDHSPRPASAALSLSDLVVARKDTLHTLLNLAHVIHLSAHPAQSKSTSRMASRAFELVASYLVDPADAISPMNYVKQVGASHIGHVRPPSLPDIALQVFTLLGHPDSNRQIFSQAVSQPRLWNLFEALIRRLPILDLDFQLMAQEMWLGYLEKVVMGIYALAFLSPPVLKKKIKTDRTLGFGRVMLRMVQKFLLAGGPQGRAIFIISAKRAVEAMKIIDDGEDSFDTAQSPAPTLTFGMGWSDVRDNGPEKGTGLLGGHLDVTWDILMQREVDELMFSELESLTRVE